jgi:hypothetical protein
MAESLGDRSFSLSDQRWYAGLSGDSNPIHLDPLAARRTQAGEVVVHGMHLLSWALDRALSQGQGSASLVRVTAVFLKPVGLDRRVSLEPAKARNATAALKIVADSGIAAEIRLWLGEASAPRGTGGEPPLVPVERRWTDTAGAAGDLPLRRWPETPFPNLGRPWAELLGGLSALVGMVCPGRHSLFTELDLRIDGSDGPYRWRVADLDERFKRVTLEVSGGGISAVVSAFMTPPPVRAPSMDELAQAVTAGEFSGQRALIIGGSRGLGELTAKLVALGGGTPVITWKTGADDAARVVAEIEAAGRSCRAIRFDSASPEEGLAPLDADGWSPTHLYYFATPKIFVAKDHQFDPGLFQTFVRTYVDDALALVRAVQARVRHRLRLYYPSTIAVGQEVGGLAEYAAAKAEGETQIRQLGQSGRDIGVVIDRLPRLLTDQTLNSLGLAAEDPVKALVPGLRRVHDC